MSRVIVRNLQKSYGDVAAVRDVSFTVEEGEIGVLLGPSGCGKTTTLRCVAGLEKPDRGEIRIGDRTVNSSSVFVPPEKRKLGMVFQSYAIWPHMTVFDNVAYGLKAQGTANKREIKGKVLQALELVHLEQLWERPATALSGGQQQRVALARSIAYDPTVLLLDEPLSNLDAKLRERMRFELVSLQQRLGVTMIYVTHDQEEAMILGDKIALMLDGNIIQWGTAHELYAEPQSEFAASFFGRSNLISGHLEEVHPKAQEGIVKISGDECVQCRVLADIQEASDVLVCVRPEDVRLVDAAKATDGSSVLAGEITAVAFLGDRYEVKVKLVQTDEELRIYDYATGETRKEGDAVGVALSAHRCIALRTES